MNSRLHLKKGPILTAHDCVALHPEVESYMRRPEHSNRSLPLMDSELQSVPKPKLFKMCNDHVDTMIRRTAASLASRMADWIKPALGVLWVYVFLKEDADEIKASRAYIKCWTYYSVCYFAQGLIDQVGGDWVFRLSLPL